MSDAEPPANPSARAEVGGTDADMSEGGVVHEGTLPPPHGDVASGISGGEDSRTKAPSLPHDATGVETEMEGREDAHADESGGVAAVGDTPPPPQQDAVNQPNPETPNTGLGLL